MIFSSNVLKRWSFQKGSRRDMIFLVLSGKVVFFSQKHGIFSMDWKRGRDELCQEIHENKIFSIWYVPGPPPCEKKSRTILFHKNKPKGDWHSRSTPYKELQQFSVLSWRPLQAFSYVALQQQKTKKKQETEYIGLKFYSVGDILQ